MWLNLKKENMRTISSNVLNLYSSLVVFLPAVVALFQVKTGWQGEVVQSLFLQLNH